MTSTVSPTPAARVERGAAWLDETYGDNWPLLLDLELLNLESACDCVLGQTFGDYDDALAGAFPGWTFIQRQTWARDHGFYRTEDLGDWADLQFEWERLIEQRVDAAVAARRELVST